MDPEKTALDFSKKVYQNAICDYLSALDDLSRKGRIRFSTAHLLIRYALRKRFYRNMGAAPYFWSGSEIEDALQHLNITDEKKWESLLDEDREDSFLCDEDIQEYKKELRREARKKSKSKKDR